MGWVASGPALRRWPPSTPRRASGPAPPCGPSWARRSDSSWPTALPAAHGAHAVPAPPVRTEHQPRIPGVGLAHPVPGLGGHGAAGACGRA
ncbi:hypothetical protein QJS66_07745 [Kocuria rhizophila]|nr:hypothetical protein QJS66_07745 [Kocuria rhizophila]